MGSLKRYTGPAACNNGSSNVKNILEGIIYWKLLSRAELMALMVDLDRFLRHYSISFHFWYH